MRNAIYHVSRRNFFDLLNRFLNFLVIIISAGVAGKAMKLFSYEELYLELAVLVLATAQLTFDFGNRARTHEFLQRKYYEMLAEIELEPVIDSRKWNSRLFTIAAEEPMPMRALDAMAYNAAVDATISDAVYRADCRLHVPIAHRLLRHFVAFHSHQYQSNAEFKPIWARSIAWLKARLNGKKNDI